MIIQKGQNLEVYIEKLSLGGDGIARVPSQKGGALSNFVIFVPYSVPGDLVQIKVTECKKTFAKGQIKKIIKKGFGRTDPPCPYFFSPEFTNRWCGGCNFQQLKYSAQLEEKPRMLREALERIAGQSSPPILPAIGSSSVEEWRYRNKIQIPLGKIKERAVAGFYVPSSHQIVSIEDCLIHSEELMSLVNFVLQKMNEWKIEPYSEISHQGWLRHLTIREEKSSMEKLLVFVTSNDHFPKKEEWCKLIQEKFPKVVGICQNVNGEKTNVILGKEWKKIFGVDFLTESLNGLKTDGTPIKLKVSAGSFFQVNTKMGEKLYKVVRDFAALEETEKEKILLDLYCGVGGIALSLSPNFHKVIGVDEVHSSIEDAKENAQLNKIANVEFFREDAGDFLGKVLLKARGSETLAVVLDPPRSGCAQTILQKIIELKAKKIIYVSCEPSTLARDIKFLSACGYRLKKVQPVDLFPQSSHIESVSLLAHE